MRRPKPTEEKPRPTAIYVTEIIEGMIDGVVITDLEGRIIQMNKSSNEMFGYSGQETTGKSVIEFIPEEEAPKARELVGKVAETGELVKNVEFTGIRRDWSRFPILVNGSLLRDEEGEPSKLLIVYKDIAELKRAEEARVKLELAHKELTALERARAFTLILFKDVFKPLLNACRPETVAKVGDRLKELSERVPMAAGMEIAGDGSVNLDEDSIREALADLSPGEGMGEVISAFSEIMNACYPLVRVDVGDQKATEIFSNLFKKRRTAPYGPDLLKVVPDGVELPDLVFKPLEPGRCYLVEESKAYQSFSMFGDMLAYGFLGLCISTTHPADVKGESGFVGKATVLWLSKAERDYAVSPSNLGILRDRISEFISQNENAVVLLNGLEYLITTNGFDTTLKFIHDIREVITLNRSVLILPAAPRALEERQLELLERYMEVIEVVGGGGINDDKYY